VENRRLDHLEDVGAVERGAVVAQVGGGEADLVVHDDVHRAAGTVAARLREVEHLLVDALAGHRRVAVDQHRQRLRLAFGAAAHLARIHRAGDDGVHDLEVRRVEGQRQVHRAAGRADVGRIAHVVLDVAGRQLLRLLAFEFGEQHRRLLAEGIDQHVEAAAVSHADDHLLHADLAGGADQLVHGEDQRFAAFEREALLADIARMQVAFERLGRGQLAQEALLVVGGVIRRGADGFQARLDPALLRDVGQVHVLGADGAAVGLPAGLEDLAQRRGFGHRLERTGAEALAEVGLGEAVIRRLQFGDVGALLALERIEIRPAVAEEAVGVDHLQDLDLLLVGRRAARRRMQRALLRTLGEGSDDRQVGDVGPGVVARARQIGELVEVVAPGRIDGTRVDEVVLVQLLDVGRVGAEQVGVGKHLFHHVITISDGCGPKKGRSLAPLDSSLQRLSIGGTLRGAAPV